MSVEITKQNLLEAYEKCDRSLNKTAKYFKVSSKTIKRRFIEFNLEYDKKVKYSVNDYFFHDLNEKSMYWLGILATDGCVRKHNYSYEVRLSLATKDKFLLEEFKKDLNFSGPILNYTKNGSIKINKNKNEKTYYNSLLAIRSKIMFDRLAEFNIVPRKTHILTLSENLKNHPLINHFIRGCIDGDGWARLHKNNYSDEYNEVRLGFCGTENFVKDIFNIINEKLNIKSASCSKQYKNDENCKTWKFEYSSQSDVYKIYKWIYNGASIILDRKYCLIKQSELFLLNQKKIIEKEELEKLYNDGYSINDLSKFFEVTQGTIRENLNKFNIQKYMLNKQIHSKYEYNYDFFNQNNEYSFYWAGFIAGKSSYVKDKYIRISSINRNAIEKFLEHSKFKMNIYEIERNENRLKSFRLEIYDKIILDQLAVFNINENKQNNFYIPEIVLNNENMRHFLRGYFEGKGGINNVGKIVFTINNSEKFINQINKIFEKSVNIKLTAKIKNKKTSSQIIYMGKQAKEIIKYLYNNCIVNNKHIGFNYE